MAKTYRYLVNNTTQYFAAIIYIDPNGNDTTGDGSLAKPYMTIKKAVSMVTVDNTAIVLNAGTYNERGQDYGNNSACGKYALFSSKQYKITFIGQGNKTIVNTDFNKTNCAVVAAGQTDVTIQNLAVKVNCSYVGDTASNCLIAGNATYDTAVTIYNCAFEFLPTGNQKGIYYDNIKGRITAINCGFYMGDVNNSWAGLNVATLTTTNFTATNCMFRDLLDWRSFGGGTKPPRFILSYCIKNTDNFWNQYSTMTDGGGNMVVDVISNSAYFPTNSTVWKFAGSPVLKNRDNSRSHIGVYGGLYQWSNSTMIPATISVENPLMQITKNNVAGYKFSITPVYTQNATINNLSGVQSFNDNTTQTYLCNIDRNMWSAVVKVEVL